MNRLVLAAVGAVVIAASIYLYVQLRGGGEPEPPEVATPTAAPDVAPVNQTTKRAPPPEADRPRPERRPPIKTRPATEATRPAVANTIAPTRANPESSAAVRDASNAYANEHFSEALKHAEEALAADDKSVLARSLAVLSACGVGRKDVAESHAAKLDERRRQPLVARCHAEYGLELTP